MSTETMLPTGETLSIDSKARVGVRAQAAGRLFFVDNLRVFLTILVVLHHLMIIYAGSGSWIWTEGRQDVITNAFGGWFTAVNQSFFMGLFLFISAYFVPGSYDRKGAARFLKDRLIRLGIPLIVYGWVVRPVLLFAGRSAYGDMRASFLDWYPWQYFSDYGFLGGGPLWFVEALLFFSTLYVLWRLAAPVRPEGRQAEGDFPGSGSIVLLVVVIAVASFLVRLWFPSDSVYRPLNFQLANFPQYIALFILGLVAYRRNWLVRLPEELSRRWLAVAIVLVLLFPVVGFLSGAIEDSTPFEGGWSWQSMMNTLFQSFLCLSMCVGLIGFFRRNLDRQGSLGKFLSRNAYTAYLIHEPVITFLALAAMGLMIYPLLKFFLAAFVALPLCFALSHLVRKLPGTSGIL